MNKTLSLIAVCASLGAQAQTTPLPYFTGFEDPMTTIDWKPIRKGDTSPYYLWTVDNAPYAGNHALFHGYPVGGSSVTDDWLVSPAFSLPDGGKIDSIRHQFSGFGVPGSGDTVAFYLLTGNPDPALASSVTLLYDFRDTRYVADRVWNKTGNITIPPVTGDAYIAFRYHTVNNWLDVRFDNLAISSSTPTAIRDGYRAGEDFTVFPLPANQSLHIRSSVSFTRMELYDISGRNILRQRFEPVADLSRIPSGSYMLVLTDEQQKKGVVSITKQ
ncbi:choice-of-anchor J domain-containing protein [Rurimicrobium arvi]|uniref:T9SS type A sorting domain-containing protein n=1 Tax=Rurimicrobium arvi TaxID=2049916 RepID=A0ABP8MYZ4_9BACT